VVRFLSQGVMGVGASDDKNDVYVKLAFGGWNAQTAVENNAGDKAVFDYDVDGRHVGDAKSMRWRSTVGEVRCYVPVLTPRTFVCLCAFLIIDCYVWPCCDPRGPPAAACGCVRC